MALSREALREDLAHILDEHAQKILQSQVDEGARQHQALLQEVSDHFAELRREIRGVSRSSRRCRSMPCPPQPVVGRSSGSAAKASSIPECASPEEREPEQPQPQPQPQPHPQPQPQTQPQPQAQPQPQPPQRPEPQPPSPALPATVMTSLSGESQGLMSSTQSVRSRTVGQWPMLLPGISIPAGGWASSDTEDQSPRNDRRGEAFRSEMRSESLSDYRRGFEMWQRSETLPDINSLHHANALRHSSTCDVISDEMLLSRRNKRMSSLTFHTLRSRSAATAVKEHKQQEKEKLKSAAKTGRNSHRSNERVFPEPVHDGPKQIMDCNRSCTDSEIDHILRRKPSFEKAIMRPRDPTGLPVVMTAAFFGQSQMFEASPAAGACEAATLFAGCPSPGRSRDFDPEKPSTNGHMLFKDVRRSSSQLDRDNIMSEENGSGSRFFQELVSHAAFTNFSGFLIVLNAIIIGAQTEYMADNLSTRGPDFFARMDNFFCIAFLLELILRIAAFRAFFFIMPGWVWNVFDVILVILQVLENVVDLFVSTMEHGGKVSGFSAMRLIRILRVIRIIRLVRMLRLIGELRTIVVCILGSLRSLVWTVALLMLVVYITATYLTHVVSEARLQAGDEQDPMLVRYYGSLFRSVLTLYEAISGGVSWDVAVVPLILHVSPALGVLFSLYIAFVMLAIMNVVTGVFVETAMQTAKTEEDDFMARSVRELFNVTDRNGNGVIDWSEFEQQLKSSHMEDTLRMIDADEGQAKELFQLLDIDDRGEVQFDDFIDGFMKLKGPAKAIDLMVVMYEHRRSTRHFIEQLDVVVNTLENVCRFLDPSAS